MKKGILSVSGRKLLNILRDTGSLTPLDVAENCRRLRRSPEEISAAVCGSLTVAEQRLLKQLLHKSIFSGEKLCHWAGVTPPSPRVPQLKYDK
jgi:hypothetical protein